MSCSDECAADDACAVFDACAFAGAGCWCMHFCVRIRVLESQVMFMQDYRCESECIFGYVCECRSGCVFGIQEYVQVHL